MSEKPKASGIKPPAAGTTSNSLACSEKKTSPMAAGKSNDGLRLSPDTSSFMVGNRVFVDGVKPGRIIFIGEVHFAPGEWAGIVLDGHEGKNDGAHLGKRYFQCEPNKGVFSRLSLLTRDRVVAATTPEDIRSIAASPTFISSKSLKINTSMQIGDRVIVKSSAGSKIGYLRFHGEPSFASGIWCGIELEDAAGRNDGTVGGRRYFQCSPGHGLFVPEAKVALSPMAKKSQMIQVKESHGNVSMAAVAATNASKLRLNSSHKDLLREKTNQIEQLIKERDNNLEEMNAQSILFEKKIDLHKENIVQLTKLLEDERKKSENLQFLIDEAESSIEDKDLSQLGNGVLKFLKARIAQLENEVRSQHFDAAGDHASPQIELNNLRVALEQTKTKLDVTEDAKKILESDILILNEKLAELLDCKTSEEKTAEVISDLENRIQELELQLVEKTKFIELRELELHEMKASKNEESLHIESEQIKKMRDELESLTTSLENVTRILAEKDSEILQMFDKESMLIDRVSQLEKSVSDQTETVAKTELELTSLQKEFTAVETKFESLQNSAEQQSTELATKSETLQQLQGKLDGQVIKISQLQFELDNSKLSINESNGLVENLKCQIAELTERQAELNNDIVKKSSALSDAEARNLDLEKQISERDRCIARLEDEIENVKQIVGEKEATITQWTKDCKELELKRQKSMHALETSKQALADELDEIKQTIKELSTKLTTSEREVAEKSLQIEQLSRAFEDTTRKLQEAEITSRNLQGDKNVLEVDKNDLSRKLGASEEKIAQLNELKSKLQQELETTKSSSFNINSELSKLHNELREKGNSFEKFQTEAETAKLSLQRRVDEVEHQNKLLEQQSNKLKTEMTELNAQKVESEFQLNQELKTVKLSSDEDKAEFDRLKSSFETEKLQLNSEMQLLHKKLDQQSLLSENLQKLVDDLKASKDILMKQYEDNLVLLHSASVASEKKEKVLVELTQKCNKQEQDIIKILHQVEKERKTKESLQLKNQNSETKFKELEDDQIDLVNRNKELKVERENAVKQLEKMKKLHEALEEKLSIETKHHENSKLATDDRINQMGHEIDKLQQSIADKDQEIALTIEKLHVREEEILRLQTAIKNLELKMETESNETVKLLKGKNEEFLKVLHDCMTKENLLDELKNNLEAMKSCLAASSDEKESKTELVKKLSREISSRDADIRGLQKKILSVEKLNKDIETQLKKMADSKEVTLTESQERIVSLIEQVKLLDIGDETKEAFEVSAKLYLLQDQLDMQGSAASFPPFGCNHKTELELEQKIKDLESREAFLTLLTQGLKHEICELKEMKGIPRKGDAYDREMKNQFDFLNSIIFDMEKTNLELNMKLEALTKRNSAESDSEDERTYCHICEAYDLHDTEDCPTQCSEMNLSAVRSK